MAERLFPKVAKSRYYMKSLVNTMTKGYVLKDRRNTVAAIHNLVKNNIHRPDIEILTLIMNILDAFPRAPKSQDRSTERAAKILKLLSGRRVERYLDFGCGDGTITHQIGAMLGLSAENIHGVDIHHTGNPNITYCRADDNLVDRLGAGQFDLITALVSFHHIENVEATLQTIYELLAPGGTLIIREHDCEAWNQKNNSTLAAYLNLIHAWISVKEYGNCDPCTLYAGIHYRRAFEWTYLLNRHDFTCSRLEFYTGNNPQQLYYARYDRAKK